MKMVSAFPLGGDFFQKENRRNKRSKEKMKKVLIGILAIIMVWGLLCVLVHQKDM